MQLSALSERSAVLAAIAEFDTLGREAFLAKYGYGPSRSYFIVYAGRRYDSKAIAGVAVGKQFPKANPLSAADFSGGEATVKAKLEQLGFAFESTPKRNPDWTREETILALDLYARRRRSLPGKEDLEIVELSRLLIRYAAQRGVQGTETFRNPAGVAMKVGNLARLDPSFARKGLPNGSGTEERVWAEFMPDTKKLGEAASAIRASILGTSDQSALPDERSDTAGKLKRALSQLAISIQQRIQLSGHEKSGLHPQRKGPNLSDLIDALNKKWAEQEGRCLLCNQAMQIETKNPLLRPSPDRIDSSKKTYDPGNVHLTHLGCNLAKNKASMDEWREYLTIVRTNPLAR